MHTQGRRYIHVPHAHLRPQLQRLGQGWRVALLVLGGGMCCGSTAWSQRYYTHPLTDEVQTLRTLTDGDVGRLPVIDNSRNSQIEISFDYLCDEMPFLQYSVVHCDAEWRADDLSELDYLDGFQPTRLTEVTPSFNTHVNYFHYSLTFPNPDVQLLVSGNYAVIVHPEDEPDLPLAIACFSVSEQQAFVGGEVSGNTDIDYLQQHQQLTLQCTWSQQTLPYLNPASELSLVVTQNRRPSTRRSVKAPSRIEAGKACYEHLGELIFEAGNTFRQFEFTDYRYATLGIERLRYQAPYYHTWLSTDQSRADGQFRLEKDLHGRCLTHALRVDDAETEAEYFLAEFTLEGAMPPRGGQGIYLTGDFTHGELIEPYHMQYDPERKSFTASVLLKQGYYNYQYVTGPEWTPDSEAPLPQISTSVVEGNYYETPNQYEVYIYYRPSGGRYDRLLGVSILE